MKIYSISVFIILNIFLKNSTCENLKLLILHNNDMHSRFEETSRTSGTCKDKANCYGGFARVLHVIREARKAAADGTGPPVLYLNAGDTYTGTSWFSVHKWKIAADFMNLLHPDVASFGNHEFAYRPSGLTPYLNTVTFPTVACNLDFSQEPELNARSIPKSWILEVSGKKIGVIGYLTPETAFTAFVGNVKFYDEIPAIISESERLNNAGVKTIIALGHSGYEMDQRIAREVPLVNLVIGGHTNTFLWNGTQPDLEIVEGPYPSMILQPSGKEVPVVQAYAFTKYMGRLEITISDDGNLIEYSGNPQLLTSAVPQEQDALDLLDTFRDKIDIASSMIVGFSKVILDGELSICRYRECTLANLVADAFVTYYKFKHNINTIGIISARTPYHSIIPNLDGSITMLDVLNALPYSGNVYSMSLYGLDIWKTLEIGVRSDGETTLGEFIHTSGIKYSFDKRMPVGSRITNVKSLGNNEFGYTPLGLEPFLRSATYPIVVANVDFAKDSVLNTSIKQSHTIEISGIKIGVIGYLTPSTFLNVYYDNVTVVDEISAIKAESERLHKEGVKTIIALGHSGYEMDKKIAEKVPLVDLVVGAHSHTFLWRGIKPDIEEPKGLYPTVIVQSSGKKVLVVQAFAKTKYMGRLTVVINTQGEIINCTGIPQLLNASVPQDEDAISLLETFRERLTIFNNTIVGTSRVVLNGSLKLCQYNECNLPNLVTDAFVSYYLSVYGRKTIAMISARSLQNNIEPLANGSISMLALINALPYNGLIWSVTLKGEDLLKTLENGVRNDHDGRHREFIYSSGITYIFNESLPVGLRIVNAKIGCHVCKSQNFRDIQPNNSYRVTTTELLYLGFDQHKIISESGWDKVQESKRELDIVSRYISRMSPIDIDVVGRIQKIN